MADGLLEITANVRHFSAARTGPYD